MSARRKRNRNWEPDQPAPEPEAEATEPEAEATEPEAEATEPEATEPEATEPEAEATEPEATDTELDLEAVAERFEVGPLRYFVSDGCSICGAARGTLLPGDEVKASDLGGGEPALERLAEKGVLRRQRQ